MQKIQERNDEYVELIAELNFQKTFRFRPSVLQSITHANL
jgi:hypothetical protein